MSVEITSLSATVQSNVNDLLEMSQTLNAMEDASAPMKQRIDELESSVTALKQGLDAAVLSIEKTAEPAKVYAEILNRNAERIRHLEKAAEDRERRMDYFGGAAIKG